MKRGFASDNNAGVHPRVMDALRSAGRGHVLAYGDDPYTEAAVAKFRGQFGASAEVFFVFGGTGANVLALASVARPHEAVVCAATAHINVDECGAPERFAGCKLVDLPTPDGKLRAEQVEPLLARAGDQHHVQPRVVSVSQATEMGTVYTAEELRRLAEFAHARGLLLHVDGARLANAAAHLGVPLRELTTAAGVDVLSFGGTKNGMMYGEAVVFPEATLARDFKFTRKQGAQLPSKMRSSPKTCGLRVPRTRTGWPGSSPPGSDRFRACGSRSRSSPTPSSPTSRAARSPPSGNTSSSTSGTRRPPRCA